MASADGGAERRVPARGEGRAVDHDGDKPHEGDAHAEDHDGPKRVDVAAGRGETQQGPTDAGLDKGETPSIGNLEEDEPCIYVKSVVACKRYTHVQGACSHFAALTVKT